MLNNHGFDLWADTYDDSVTEADRSNRYPFAGYHELMNAIYGTVMHRTPADILDIGFGTAMLTTKLYDAGNRITGFDFSTEMLNIAKNKMPDADLFQWDFTHGVPSVLEGCGFDFIVSTYAMHHLSDEAKIDFISDLLRLLNPEGVMLIGDVAFRTREKLTACRKEYGDRWDSDEHYFVFSELREQLETHCTLTYHPVSFCAGIIEIRN